MTLAVLTEAEKVRIRHHLGYLQPVPAAAIILGLPAATQTSFLVERAMNALTADSIGLIRANIARLDQIESELDDCRKRLRASVVGEITLRNDEADAIRAEYTYWKKRCADDLGVPINPYSEIYRAGAALNIPVIN